MFDETKKEIKNFTLQNYIEIFIFNVMIVLAIIGNKGEAWATIIYMCIVTMFMLTFMFSVLIKLLIDPSVIYYSIYFLNLLMCVAFGWWWLAVYWGIILICAGIGMDRCLKSRDKKNENKN